MGRVELTKIQRSWLRVPPVDRKLSMVGSAFQNGPCRALKNMRACVQLSRGSEGQWWRGTILMIRVMRPAMKPQVMMDPTVQMKILRLTIMHPRSTYFFYSPRPSSQLYCISSSGCDSAAQSKSYRSGSGHRRRLSPCLSSVAHPQISTVHPHLAKDGWVRINVADEVKRKWEGMERNSLTAFSLSLSPPFLLSAQCGCFTEDEEVERKGPCRVLCLN